MSKPTPEVVQLIHPDYPTPIRQVNELYEKHAETVQSILTSYIDLRLPDDVTALFGPLTDMLDRVIGLHQPYANTKWFDRKCRECYKEWPCPTAKALEQVI